MSRFPFKIIWMAWNLLPWEILFQASSCPCELSWIFWWLFGKVKLISKAWEYWHTLNHMCTDTCTMKFLIIFLILLKYKTLSYAVSFVFIADFSTFWYASLNYIIISESKNCFKMWYFDVLDWQNILILRSSLKYIFVHKAKDNN